jgi:hypothetical protein
VSHFEGIADGHAVSNGEPGRLGLGVHRFAAFSARQRRAAASCAQRDRTALPARRRDAVLPMPAGITLDQ